MRIVLAAIAACCIAGCAHPPRPITEASDYEVCQALILGNPVPNGQQIVAVEMQRRHLDCAPYSQAIVQQDAARRQQAMQAYQIMQASQPAPAPVYQIPAPTPPVNCTSTRWGNQVQTTCR